MKRLAPLAFALVFAPPASADVPQPRMRAQVIDAQIKIGYGLAIEIGRAHV